MGARRRSDTVLVSTINDADQGSADVAYRTPPAPYEKSKSFRNPIFKCNNETNYPIIIPLIPRYYDDDLGIEVFTTQFSSTCLLDSIKEKYKRIDNQIVNMIDAYAKGGKVFRLSS